MATSKAYTATGKLTFSLRLREYVILTKFRLSFLVVFSAFLSYLLTGKNSGFDILMLVIGGFLVTGSSNGFNQVLEREFDKLMKRTQNRPLVKGTLSVTESIVVSVLMGAVGLYCLYLLNPLSAVLGFLALFIYVCIYTPMKRVSPWAVFVGAFPGAIPPLLGYVAANGEFGLIPGILFLVQFMWQFPHFWAIAWVLDDDYKNAGYRLLPSKFGRNRASSFQIVIYTAACVATSFAPFIIDIAGLPTVIVCAVAGVFFMKYALTLHASQDIKDARKLMFASFLYLPLIQIIYVIDKFI